MATPRDDRTLIDLATNPGVIAVVGFSTDPARPSYGVAQSLIAHGLTTYLVNPMYAGQTRLGRTILAGLSDVPEPIRIVDVFRRAEGVLAIVEEAIAVQAEALWLQLGIFSDAAIARAQAAGMRVVVDRCLKVEYDRIHAR